MNACHLGQNTLQKRRSAFKNGHGGFSRGLRHRKPSKRLSGRFLRPLFQQPHHVFRFGDRFGPTKQIGRLRKQPVQLAAPAVQVEKIGGWTKDNHSQNQKLER